MEKVTIVIPAYNEEGALGPVIDALKSLPLEANILVIDDGSTDRTGEIAKAHGATVVTHAVNCGYGRSVKDAVREATTDIIIVSDADGTYPIDQIPVLLTQFNRGFDMVVGARQGETYRGGFFKAIGRASLKAMVEYATGRTVPDVNSGLRVFRKSVAEPYFPDICEGFSFTTTITLVYMLTHHTVHYVPIAYHKRVGHSKVKIIKDTLRTMQYIVECVVRYNPLKMYLLLCAFTFAAGIISMPLGGWAAFFLGLYTTVIVFGIGLIAETMRRPRQG